MNDVRVMIVDDEEGARESLSNLLENYVEGVQIVAKSESIDSAMVKIEKYTPELVFLDVEMPFDSGFELLELMKPINFNIVFVTAYDHSALKAIKFSALDYLLKPFDIEDLKKAIKKHVHTKKIPPTDSYDNLIENFKSDYQERKLAIPDSNGITFIAISSIIRCESDGNYTRLFMNTGKKILVSKTLGEYENMLAGDGFFRVHRGHLVNMSQIHRFFKTESGIIEMSDGTQVDVSRRKKTAFMEAFNARKQ